MLETIIALCNMLGLVSYTSLLMNTMMLLIVKNCNKAWDMGFAVCLDRVVMGGRLLRTRDYCTHSSCY
jgi:hypothetical protein